MAPMTNGASHDDHPYRKDIDSEPVIPKRLILCFDGTGNVFQGNTNDTNIVKLLDMFDRSAPRQMHYYQPGIGTYSTDGSVNTSFIGGIKRNISQTIDSGLATSFDAHVIAGYRFLMRYYSLGDRIYIFGFSRGAYTARFVARMIFQVGLLSMGNEEMVPFAYKLYQDYEMGKDTDGNYMGAFRSTFCRHDPVTPSKGIKTHFLGLFDTVNSVGTFDVPFNGAIKVPTVHGTAEHVRHAVAIDERRVKFKAALLAQDKKDDATVNEDVKEVWFPGNHGDIGGGWPAETEEEATDKLTWRTRIHNFFHQTKAPLKCEHPYRAHMNKEGDKFQLSDIALKWMIDELDKLAVNCEHDRPEEHINWHTGNKKDFLERFDANRPNAIRGRMHDTMTFGRGSSFGMTIMWKLMEYLPFIKRWEYYPEIREPDKRWQYTRFPLNKGGTRDIPRGALFHHAVIERLQQFSNYRPTNQITVSDREGKLYQAANHVVENDATPPLKTPYFVPIEPQENVAVTDQIYELKRC